MFSENASLSKLIRQRPIVIELLETTGHSFWNHLDMTVESFCRETGTDFAELLRVAETMPVPSSDSDWNRERSYRIVDFLNAEHRQFRDEDIPILDRLFSRQDSSELPNSFGMKFAYGIRALQHYHP